MSVIHFQAEPATAEYIGIGTGCAVALTTGNYYISTGLGRGQGAEVALVSLEYANIRFHYLGTSPATDTGNVLAAGDYLVLDRPEQMANLRLFNEGKTATAAVRVTYFIS